MIRVSDFEKKPCACPKADECTPSEQAELQALDTLVNNFAEAMKAQLRKKYYEGKRDWDKPVYANGMMDALEDRASEGKWVDVANFAAMLWNFEQE
jgi:hypothetical protein